MIEEIVSSRQSSSGPLTSTEAIPRENWSRWSRTLRDTWGRATGTRTYFDIPASGEGSAGLHYQETSIQRDAKNREIRLVDATGTIERRVYDVRDVVTQIWIGPVLIFTPGWMKTRLCACSGFTFSVSQITRTCVSFWSRGFIVRFFAPPG